MSCSKKSFDADGQLAGGVADVAKCSDNLSDTASVRLPADLPVPAGTHAYQYARQGQAKVWFTTLDGSSASLVKVRDTIRSALLAVGYHEVSHDQEPGAEADLSVSGPHDTSVQVRPLCRHKIRVRYVVNS